MQPVSPILLVTRGLDPVGTGRQVELAAAGLAAAGYEVAVAVTSTGGSLADRLLAGGAGLHVVGRRPGVDAAATARLAGLVARLRPAAIIGFGRSQAIPLAVVSLHSLARPAAPPMANGLGHRPARRRCREWA